jgi:hypothetical protein
MNGQRKHYIFYYYDRKKMILTFLDVNLVRLKRK